MRKFLANTTAIGRRFKQDEKGVTALSFALALTVLLGAIGVGMDVSVANKSKNRAQQIADSVALNAAAFWRENERKPKWKERHTAFRHNKWYKASDFGYDFGALTRGEVWFKVRYHADLGESRVIIKGKTRTTFTSFFGKKDMTFRAMSTAHFEADRLIAPISVIVVTDNSGSMHFDDKPTELEWEVEDGYGEVDDFETPDPVKARIDGLKTAVNGFLVDLESTSGEQEMGRRSVRMGLLPYSSDTIHENKVEMKWGFLKSSDINEMEPNGGTNSAPPMAEAEQWMAGEDAIHLNETGKKPLRFVVFLTDGMNTTKEWVAQPDTNYWRRQNCHGRAPEEYCHTGQWFWNNGWKRHGMYHHRGSWHLKSDSDLLGEGYEEGSYELLADQKTLDVCNRMRNQGVRVFTIAFALKQGDYYVGDWPGMYHWSSKNARPLSWPKASYSRDKEYNYYPTTSDNYTNATALMENCAFNKETDFVNADDNEALQQAFAEIAAKIEKEVIRLAH